MNDKLPPGCTRFNNGVRFFVDYKKSLLYLNDNYSIMISGRCASFMSRSSPVNFN